MAAAQRSILHVDMDAFYASIEQRDDPSLRGKAVVVGGDTNRGVVAAASYEARRFGIRSAMPMRDAMRRCPDLVRVRPRMSHYAAVSGEIFDIFRDITPLVEGLSLDEAFLDVTGSLALFGGPVDIAREVKRRIREKTALTASVGVAQNKLVAKIASDLDKPDGLTVLYPDDYAARLDPLPVGVIPGIGPKTLERLHAIGIRKVADLRTATDAALVPVFGRYASKTRARAAGIDDRPVEPDREEQSISAEETYEHDLDSPDAMDREILRLAERTASRLRKANLVAGTIQLKIRRDDFSTFTRQCAARPPTDGTDRIHALGRGLLHAWLAENPGARVRLLGVGGSNLTPSTQRDLFEQEDLRPDTSVDRAIDKVRDRFGSASVSRARTLRRP